ncbi:MAG: hypothetical protein QOF51_3837 [Chloroflexota bacterium]|jgi:uncharacterized membrane protein YkvA (DUF1232 family)|nr:hypothetical protein [Chloroflexota bacterium]
MATVARLRQWARSVKRDSYALYLACRDPRTPWYAKAVAGLVVAYAFSPLDLIPDFIPVLGYLDDAVIVPLGILLALRLVPEPVMTECRAAALAAEGRPTNRVAAVIIVAVWLLAAGFVIAVVRDILD